MKIIRSASITPAIVTSNVLETAPAEYNSGTTYAVGQAVAVHTGTARAIYLSLQNANTSHAPDSSPTWWQYLSTTYVEYSGATTYAAGDIVIDTASTHRAYQSIAGSNVGNALSDETKWLDIGPTNRMAMFDQLNGTATTRADLIDVTITPTGRCDGLALLNVAAVSVQVTVTVGASTLYDQTFSLVSDSGITSWYEYFSEEVIRKSDLVLTGLPLDSNPTIRVQAIGAGETVSIGSCITGLTRDLGGTEYGARTGIQDYSKKTVDDFGNYTIVQRAFSKRATFKCRAENTQIDAITSILAEYRATPLVWIGTGDFAHTWIFGFYKDHSIEISYVSHSYISLEIEGLT